MGKTQNLHQHTHCDPTQCVDTMIEQCTFIMETATHLARQNTSLLAALKASRIERENEVSYLEDELELANANTAIFQDKFEGMSRTNRGLQQETDYHNLLLHEQEQKMQALYEDHCEAIQDKWRAQNTLSIMLNHMPSEQIPVCVICMERMRDGHFVDTACDSCKKACVHSACFNRNTDSCPCCRQMFTKERCYQ